MIKRTQTHTHTHTHTSIHWLLCSEYDQNLWSKDGGQSSTNVYKDDWLGRGSFVRRTDTHTHTYTHTHTTLSLECLCYNNTFLKCQRTKWDSRRQHTITPVYCCSEHVFIAQSPRYQLYIAVQIHSNQTISRNRMARPKLQTL